MTTADFLAVAVSQQVGNLTRSGNRDVKGDIIGIFCESISFASAGPKIKHFSLLVLIVLKSVKYLGLLCTVSHRNGTGQVVLKMHVF